MSFTTLSKESLIRIILQRESDLKKEYDKFLDLMVQHNHELYKCSACKGFIVSFYCGRNCYQGMCVDEQEDLILRNGNILKLDNYYECHHCENTYCLECICQMINYTPRHLYYGHFCCEICFKNRAQKL